MSKYFLLPPPVQDWSEACFIPLHSSVRSSVTKLVNMIFLKRINRFCYKLSQVGMKWSTSGIKDQGHRRAKLDRRPGGGIVLDPLGGVAFLVFEIQCVLYHCSYPMQPPVVRFVTKVFHPNISRHGDVGLDSIHHNWSLALTISKVLLSIQSLLTDPFWYVCMEPTIGQMYRNNISEFNRIARLWTWKYSMHDYLKPFSDNVIAKTVCTL